MLGRNICDDPSSAKIARSGAYKNYRATRAVGKPRIVGLYVMMGET